MRVNRGPICLLLLCALPLQGAVHQVAPGQFATLPQLNPGDIVELAPGTYHEVKRFSCNGTADQPIIIRGTGKERPIIDATGRKVDGGGQTPRGCIQIDGSWVIVEHLELCNAHNGNNGTGFRLSGGKELPDAATVVLRDCSVHDNDMGIQSDGGGHLVVEGCEVFHNGCPEFQFSHNFYVMSEIITIRGCWIHDPVRCYNVKTRGHQVELLYNLITDSREGEVDLVDSEHTNKANSNAVLIGNVIASNGGGQNRFIVFGGEGQGRQGTLYASNNTFIAGTGRIRFFELGVPGLAVVATDNIFVGSGNLGGGSITGSGNWSQAALGGGPPGFLAGTGDPGFVDAAARDFRLNPASPCRNAGVAAPPYKDGGGVDHPSLPEWMYEMPAKPGLGRLVRRGVDGKIDIGAYEVGGTIAKGSPTGGPAKVAGGGDTAEAKPRGHLPLGLPQAPRQSTTEGKGP